MMRQKVQLSGVEAEGVLINNDVRVTYFAGPRVIIYYRTDRYRAGTRWLYYYHHHPRRRYYYV